MFQFTHKQGEQRLRRTARAVILRNGQMLLLERWRRNKHGKQRHYYSIPGGGIDRGETPEDAVIRELREEMLIDIRPIRLLARQVDTKRGNYHHYFLSEIVSGEPTFNMQSEEGTYRFMTGNKYAVAWLPLEEVAAKIHHHEYRQLVELLPQLLADDSALTVDIDASDEYTS